MTGEVNETGVGDDYVYMWIVEAFVVGPWQREQAMSRPHYAVVLRWLSVVVGVCLHSYIETAGYTGYSSVVAGLESRR